VTVGFIFGTVFVIGYLLGEMTQCLASQISRKIHYEHELSVIESHLAGLGLNKSKRDIVADYYKLVWKRFRGMPYYLLLRELPYPLRADICFEIYESNLKNSRVLGSVDDQVLRQLTARIRHEFYLPGGHIVRGGNVCDAMYFVKRGEILIIDENMGIELCVETLYENDCFGEIKILLPREAYRFSYVARIESEVGMLKRDDLDEVLKNFPGLRNELLEKVRNAKFQRHSDKDHDDMRGDRGKDDVRSRKSNSKKLGTAEKKMKPLDMKQAEIAKIETIAVRQDKPNFVRNNTALVPPKAPKQQQRKPDQQGKNPKDMKQANVSKIETINTAQQDPYFTRNNLGTAVASPPRLQPQTRPPQVRKVEQRPMTSLRKVDPLNQAVNKGYSSLIQGPQSYAIREVRSLPPYLSAQQTGLGSEVPNNLITRTSLNGTAENPGTAQGQNPVLFEYIPRNPGKNSQKTGTTTRQRNPPKK
jgi:CRP-like cAMP-binding protein